MYNDTPLHLAVASGSSETVQVLIKYGANTNATNARIQYSVFLKHLDKLPLNWATRTFLPFWHRSRKNKHFTIRKYLQNRQQQK